MTRRSRPLPSFYAPAVALRDVSRTAMAASSEGTLSDEAKALFGRLMQTPMFDGERVAAGACAAAFREQRYLTPEDLSSIEAAPSTSSAPFSDRSALVDVLQANNLAIIAEAKKRVDAFPGIYEEGGGLYPPVRAERCMRDFHTFLQVVCYATAAGEPNFSNPKGAAILRELYSEMDVPLDPMLEGVEGLRDASNEWAAQDGVPAAAWGDADASFGHLLQVLRFR